MGSKLFRIGLVALAVILVTAGSFSGGFFAGHYAATTGLVPALAGAPLGTANGQGGTPADLTQQFSPFWEAWALVHKEYVNQPVDDQKLAYGAIKGMLQALGDNHTGYDTPTESAILFSDASGELEGIGAEVSAKGDFVEIVSPMPGSPAEAAGILPGDLIMGVDGEETIGQDLFTVISKVRGPAGSTVILTIARAGEADPLEFTIVRAKITIPSVESKMLKGGIAYLKINQFGEQTTAELKAQLETLMANKPTGLILDLRNNPGGYRDAAITVASQFIDSGPIMFQRYGDGRQETFEAETGGLALNVPLIVLVNKGSASASEIIAGAIQDYNRGQVVGEQSYGKGTVQDWRRLSNDQGSVRLTIARWLTPQERSIDQVGITPDVIVELTKKDREAKLDPQLDKAVALLNGG